MSQSCIRDPGVTPPQRFLDPVGRILFPECCGSWLQNGQPLVGLCLINLCISHYDRSLPSPWGFSECKLLDSPFVS